MGLILVQVHIVRIQRVDFRKKRTLMRTEILAKLTPSSIEVSTSNNQSGGTDDCAVTVAEYFR